LHRSAKLEGITVALSTQPNNLPSWKQEVNQRLAAHKNRKGSAAATGTRDAVQSGAGSRAAETAARVAARFAKAPSYSELQAAETRVAVRAAEIATKVALEAQAAAEDAVAEMHAAVVEQPSRGPAVVETFAAPVRRQMTEQVQDLRSEAAGVAQAQGEARSQATLKDAYERTPKPAAAVAQPDLFFTPTLAEGQSFGIRWEPDMPVRSAERKPVPTRRHEEFELSAEDWWTPAEVSATLRSEPIEIVEPEPTHANLIEFPRELVATRKIRPRLAEAACGAALETEGQLSIFEVDPRSVSTEVESAEAMLEMAAPAWNGASGAEWSGMELDAQPVHDSSYARNAEPNAAEGPFLAPLGLRLMALVVDGALIVGMFFAAAFVAAAEMSQPPVGKPAEMMAVVGLVLTLLLYHALFFTLAMSTPGMKYAGIGLCTFDNASPTRTGLRKRLGAMVLSLLPMGLGIVWAVFDEDHLSWHDRISQTYLRKL
jgi:uncharacterized RDD family membrane protein YckC